MGNGVERVAEHGLNLKGLHGHAGITMRGQTLYSKPVAAVGAELLPCASKQ